MKIFPTITGYLSRTLTMQQPVSFCSMKVHSVRTSCSPSLEVYKLQWTHEMLLERFVVRGPAKHFPAYGSSHARSNLPLCNSEWQMIMLSGILYVVRNVSHTFQYRRCMGESFLD